MRITKKQQKELSDVIESNNLNIFDFEHSGNLEKFFVKYKYDYFSFSIEKIKDDNYNYTILSIYSTVAKSGNSGWNGTTANFKAWVKSIAEEINTTTGWEFIANNYSNKDYKELEINFTDEEKKENLNRLEELKKEIIKLELPKNNLKFIEKKIDELSYKLDELKKFDWHTLLISTFINFLVSGIISNEHKATIWNFINVNFLYIKEFIISRT